MVDVIKSWAQENGISGTLSVLCANPEVKKLIMDDMTAWGKDGGLKSFEQVLIVLFVIGISLNNKFIIFTSQRMTIIVKYTL